MKGLCPHCLSIGRLTKHHIYPKRHYNKKNAPVLWLCEDCHKEIEKIIPNKKTKKHELLALTIKFLGENCYDDKMQSM